MNKKRNHLCNSHNAQLSRQRGTSLQLNLHMWSCVVLKCDVLVLSLKPSSCFKWFPLWREDWFWHKHESPPGCMETNASSESTPEKDNDPVWSSASRLMKNSWNFECNNFSLNISKQLQYWLCKYVAVYWGFCQAEYPFLICVHHALQIVLLLLRFKILCLEIRDSSCNLASGLCLHHSQQIISSISCSF